MIGHSQTPKAYPQVVYRLGIFHPVLRNHAHKARGLPCHGRHSGHLGRARPAARLAPSDLSLFQRQCRYCQAEHLPSFKETDFLMHWVEKPGTSLEAMQRITVQVSRELRDIPGVRNFGSHIGRAEVADEVVGPNFTELWISVDPDVKLDDRWAERRLRLAVSLRQSFFSMEHTNGFRLFNGEGDGLPGLFQHLYRPAKSKSFAAATGRRLFSQ